MTTPAAQETGFSRPEDNEALNAAVRGTIERVTGFRALFCELCRMRLVMDATRKHENNLGTSIFHPVGKSLGSTFYYQNFSGTSMNWEDVDRDTAHRVAQQFCENPPKTRSVACLLPSVQIELRVRRAIMEREAALRAVIQMPKTPQDPQIVGNYALLDAYLRGNPDADALLFACMRDAIRRQVASFTEMAIMMR
ncbi:MAG: hypothetical protein PHO92_03835 [Candidatus Peribacteraceae bacterium]|nr:hypothetical protein [Candidatus Peribacteraceae bacterium]